MEKLPDPGKMNEEDKEKLLLEEGQDLSRATIEEGSEKGSSVEKEEKEGNSNGGGSSGGIASGEETENEHQECSLGIDWIGWSRRNCWRRRRFVRRRRFIWRRKKRKKKGSNSEYLVRIFFDCCHRQKEHLVCLFLFLVTLLA